MRSVIHDVLHDVASILFLLMVVIVNGGNLVIFCYYLNTCSNCNCSKRVIYNFLRKTMGKGRKHIPKRNFAEKRREKQKVYI